MSKFSARITVNAGEKTKAIFDSVSIDNEFYPENPVTTTVSLDGDLVVLSESEQLSHLRANLNSTLRLIQACYGSIESVEI